MQTIEQALARLSTSKFRSRFKLTQQDKQYIADKGLVLFDLMLLILLASGCRRPSLLTMENKLQ